MGGSEPRTVGAVSAHADAVQQELNPAARAAREQRDAMVFM
jgi:hypothetical protein